MSVDMPARDDDVHFRSWLDFHVLGKLSHATLEVLWPLASDVVCNKYPGQCNTDERRKNQEVHITISSHRISQQQGLGVVGNALLLSFLKVTSTILSYKRVSWTDDKTGTWDGITWGAARLCPDNSIVLRLAGIDLDRDAHVIEMLKEMQQAVTYLGLIDIVSNKILICGLLYKRPPSRHQFNIF